MRQHVEELEKEVNNYRMQAQAQRQPDGKKMGDGRGPIDEDMIMVDSSGSNKATTESRPHDNNKPNGRKTTITVDTGLPGAAGRARTSKSNFDSQSGDHVTAQAIGAGPTPVITPRPSPLSNAQILTVASNPQSHSPRHQLVIPETGDPLDQPQPQSYGSTMSHGSPHSSDEARENLRSPTDLAAASYINPDLLSQTAHPRPADAFAQPYYSPPISNLGTFPLTSYMDFSVPPIQPQGQFSPHNQEWSWSNAASGGSSRRLTRGQEQPRGR